MKKLIALGILCAAAALPVFAQGLYLDVGGSIGKGWTKSGGEDCVEALEDAGYNTSEMAIEMGFKAGYGPFGRVPLYLVGELAVMAHRIWDDDYYIQFNSYLIGPGVIFYPLPLVQLGVSLGYSLVANVTDYPGLKALNSKEGYAWNAFAAIDLGKKNHGCLIGIKYFYAENTLKVTRAVEKSSMVGIFVKYTYRKKAPPLF